MNLVEKILLNNFTSLKEAIQVIDTGGMKIALVVDKDKRLIGTVSDGEADPRSNNPCFGAAVHDLKHRSLACMMP